MCSCKNSNENVSEYPELAAILPPDYSYLICRWSRIDSNNSESIIRINITTKEDALLWIKKFQLLSNATFNKERTFRDDSLKNKYKVHLKCIHNTKPKNSVKKPHQKHTKCPAKLLVTVKKTQLYKNQKSRSNDIHMPKYPMTVTYYNKHNHKLSPASAVKFSPLISEVKSLFQSSFDKRFTADMSLFTLEDDVNENESNYPFKIDGGVTEDTMSLFSLDDDINENGSNHDLQEDRVTDSLSLFASEDDISENLSNHPLQEHGTVTVDTLPVFTSEHNINENGSNHDFQEEEKTKTIEDFLNFALSVAEKVRKNNETFLAIRKFLENSRQLKTENSLNSALRSFGKFVFFDVNK